MDVGARKRRTELGHDYELPTTPESDWNGLGQAMEREEDAKESI